MSTTKKTLDEENAEKKYYGGLTKEQILAAAEKVAALEAEKSEVIGDLSAAQEAFDKLGGHKPALKLANKLKRMESSKAQDFFLAFIDYMDALGIFDQHDILNPMPGQVVTQGAAPESAAAESTH